MKHTITVLTLLLTLGTQSQVRYSVDTWQWGGLDRSTGYHFAVGAIVGVGGQILDSPLDRVLAGWYLGTMAGWAKEMQDRERYGLASRPDLISTSVGALAGALVVEGIRTQWPKIKKVKVGLRRRNNSYKKL